MQQGKHYIPLLRTTTNPFSATWINSRDIAFPIVSSHISSEKDVRSPYFEMIALF